MASMWLFFSFVTSYSRNMPKNEKNSNRKSIDFFLSVIVPDTMLTLSLIRDRLKRASMWLFFSSVTSYSRNMPKKWEEFQSKKYRFFSFCYCARYNVDIDSQWPILLEQMTYRVHFMWRGCEWDQQPWNSWKRFQICLIRCFPLGGNCDTVVK